MDGNDEQFRAVIPTPPPLEQKGKQGLAEEVVWWDF